MRGNRAVLTVLLVVTVIAGCAGPAAPPAAPPTPSPGSADVPVALVRDGTGVGCVTTDVAVAGGPPVRVELDTGSAGLLLDQDSVGPGAQPTGRRATAGLIGRTFPVDVVRTPVSVGAVTTAGPVEVGSVPTADAADVHPAKCGDVHGVLGIATGSAGGTSLVSPLARLAGSLPDGWSLGLDGAAGVLRPGRPVVTPRSVVVPLTPVPGRSAGARPVYRNQIMLCWTVGARRGCGPTTVDTGGPSAAIRPDLIPDAGYPPVAQGQAGELLRAGVPVSVAAPDGTVLSSFTTSRTPPENGLRLVGLFGESRANTGLGFVERNDVGVDLAAGRAVFTPHA